MVTRDRKQTKQPNTVKHCQTLSSTPPRASFCGFQSVPRRVRSRILSLRSPRLPGQTDARKPAASTLPRWLSIQARLVVVIVSQLRLWRLGPEVHKSLECAVAEAEQVEIVGMTAPLNPLNTLNPLSRLNRLNAHLVSKSSAAG